MKVGLRDSMGCVSDNPLRRHWTYKKDHPELGTGERLFDNQVSVGSQRRDNIEKVLTKGESFQGV